ncbi:hypothetical protein [Nocardia wallacei]|nr:hypothetical protein [Nocardia wallacei]
MPLVSELRSAGKRPISIWACRLAVALGLVGSMCGAGVAAAEGAEMIQQIAVPPGYAGTVDNSADCVRRYETRGFEPKQLAGAKHPLFLYFVGTNIGKDAETDRRENAPAANAVAEAMARRGFVALVVEYDNSLPALFSDHGNQTRCLFSPREHGSLLNAACALHNVDCDSGIATWGHSQGGAVAHLAPNHDPRVRAVWTTGYAGNMPSVLSKYRLRVLAGENEGEDKARELTKAAGFDPSECPDAVRGVCLRADGSGWVLVRKTDVETSADHCWFYRRSCLDSEGFLEPSWVDRHSTKPYAIESNADWVARTARAA